MDFAVMTQGLVVTSEPPRGGLECEFDDSDMLYGEHEERQEPKWRRVTNAIQYKSKQGSQYVKVVGHSYTSKLVSLKKGIGRVTTPWRRRKDQEEQAFDSPKLKVLYIEGLSPGPGFPDPLLSKWTQVVKIRMPYGFFDLAFNPWVFILLLLLAASFTALTHLYRNNSHDKQMFLATLFFVSLDLCVGWHLKRRALCHVVQACVRAHERAIEEHTPDVVVGYSWGGGIATSLLAEQVWTGPTVLIAPAGELMWKHAGLSPPLLDKVAPSAAILIVHGTDDLLVPLEANRRLHLSAPFGSSQMVIGEGEDHFLARTVTRDFLRDWIPLLHERSQH